VNQVIAKRMVKKQQMRWTPAFSAGAEPGTRSGLGINSCACRKIPIHGNTEP
jgi:hypothetical protein